MSPKQPVEGTESLGKKGREWYEERGMANLYALKDPPSTTVLEWTKANIEIRERKEAQKRQGITGGKMVSQERKKESKKGGQTKQRERGGEEQNSEEVGSSPSAAGKLVEWERSDGNKEKEPRAERNEGQSIPTQAVCALLGVGPPKAPPSQKACCGKCRGVKMTWSTAETPLSARHPRRRPQPSETVGVHTNSTHPATFPTKRRPVRRKLDRTTPIATVDDCLNGSRVTIGSMAVTDEQRTFAKRILYTWKDLFATDVTEIRKTDLVEHRIPLNPGARPYQARQHLYTPEERQWFDENLPKLLEANIICFCDSPWSAKSKFVRKTNGKLRFVNVFCPLNKATAKAVYPMQRSEVVTDTILRDGCNVFFACDGSNGYWGVPTAQADIYKTAFTTPNGQFAWTRIGQGLTGGPFTYSKFGNIAYGRIPAPEEEPALHGTHNLPPRQRPYSAEDTDRMDLQPEEPTGNPVLGEKVNFSFFMDDSYGSASSFDAMAQFLHYHFFPRCEWAPMALNPEKSVFFAEKIEILGMTGSRFGLRPNDRKLEVLRNYPTPKDYAEVEAFLYLTPFLRRFIPGRAEHATILKRAKKDDDTFIWTEKEQRSFEHLRDSILNNACIAGDPEVQYHLACDASKTGIGAVLFQLMGQPPGTKATASLRHAERIVMFISQKLSKAESNYATTDREALAVVRALEEVRHLVLGSKHPVMLYTDHSALTSLLCGDATKGRIATWQNILSEYDLRIAHVPGRELVLADGLSRLPHRAQWPETETKEPVRPLKLEKVESDAEKEKEERTGGARERRKMEIGVMECFSGEMTDEDDLTALAMRAMEIVEMQGGENAENKLEGRVREWTSKEPLSEEEARRIWDKMAEWKEWLDSEWYGDILHFKFTGRIRPGKEDRGKRRLRWVQRQARKFVVSPAHQGLLYRETNGQTARCLFPDDVPEALYRVHNVHGHFFTPINQKRALGRYYWPSRYKDIATYASSCDACQRMGPMKQWRKTRPIFVLNPMSMLGMDFFGPISPLSTSGNRYGLIICDYMTRYIWLFATPNAEFITVKGCLEEVFRSHGRPVVIYSDGGPGFKPCGNWLATEGVLHLMAPPYHPQSVGLAEIIVKMVIHRLRCFWSENPEEVIAQWDLYLPEIATSINTREMRRFGFSPFELMYGRKYDAQDQKPLISAWLNERNKEVGYEGYWEEQEEEEVLGTDILERTEEMREQARGRLLEDQDKLIAREEKKRWNIQKGDLVLLRNHALDKRYGQKLIPRWMGPYRVVGHTAASSHILEHPDGLKLKGRYNIDSLKPYLSREDVKGWGKEVDKLKILNYKMKGLDLREQFEGEEWE